MPRCYTPEEVDSPSVTGEVHIFCDASEGLWGCSILPNREQSEQDLPGVPYGKVQSRTQMAPVYAKTGAVCSGGRGSDHHSDTTGPHLEDPSDHHVDGFHNCVDVVTFSVLPLQGLSEQGWLRSKSSLTSIHGAM